MLWLNKRSGKDVRTQVYVRHNIHIKCTQLRYYTSLSTIVMSANKQALRQVCYITLCQLSPSKVKKHRQKFIMNYLQQTPTYNVGSYRIKPKCGIVCLYAHARMCVKYYISKINCYCYCYSRVVFICCYTQVNFSNLLSIFTELIKHRL